MSMANQYQYTACGDFVVMIFIMTTTAAAAADDGGGDGGEADMLMRTIKFLMTFAMIL